MENIEIFNKRFKEFLQINCDMQDELVYLTYCNPSIADNCESLKRIRFDRELIVKHNLHTRRLSSEAIEHILLLKEKYLEEY